MSRSRAYYVLTDWLDDEEAVAITIKNQAGDILAEATVRWGQVTHEQLAAAGELHELALEARVADETKHLIDKLERHAALHARFDKSQRIVRYPENNDERNE